MKTATEVLRESKSLVKELDELIATAREMKSIGFSKLDEIFKGKEYEGEMVIEDGTVRIVQEVGIGVKPDVRYSGGKVVIKFGGNVREYEVGCLDKESIEATLVNGVLTVVARRCDYAGEDSGDIQEEQEGGRED